MNKASKQILLNQKIIMTALIDMAHTKCIKDALLDQIGETYETLKSGDEQ